MKPTPKPVLAAVRTTLLPQHYPMSLSCPSWPCFSAQRCLPEGNSPSVLIYHLGAASTKPHPGLRLGMFFPTVPWRERLFQEVTKLLPSSSGSFLVPFLSYSEQSREFGEVSPILASPLTPRVAFSKLLNLSASRLPPVCNRGGPAAPVPALRADRTVHVQGLAQGRRSARTRASCAHTHERGPPALAVLAVRTVLGSSSKHTSGGVVLILSAASKHWQGPGARRALRHQSPGNGGTAPHSQVAHALAGAAGAGTARRLHQEHARGPQPHRRTVWPALSLPLTSPGQPSNLPKASVAHL